MTLCPVTTRRIARLSAANQALVAAEEALTAERDSRREAEGGQARALAELEAAVAELSGLRCELDEARQDKVRGGGRAPALGSWVGEGLCWTITVLTLRRQGEGLEEEGRVRGGQQQHCRSNW